MTHLLRITAATALITLCTLLPFLPGRYDGLAVPLSAMAQMVGTVGLILAVIGALWMTAERMRQLARLRFTLGLLAFLTLSFVWALVALAAAVLGGFALGVVTLALGGYVARRVWPSFKRPRGVTRDGSSAAPLYLVVVPVVVALLQQAVVEKAVAFSRNRAIRNSAPLIAAIEQYRATQHRHWKYFWFD